MNLDLNAIFIVFPPCVLENNIQYIEYFSVKENTQYRLEKHFSTVQNPFREILPKMKVALLF